MRINNIKICNFSSYSGENYFDFSVSSEEPIILIGGQNGTGKTSLFTAIKLALYGHLCFKYQSSNAQYLNKVKELINQDAFASEEVKAYAQVEIELTNDCEKQIYVLHREWIFVDQKIKENLTILKNNKKLDDVEIGIFHNYLFTIVPPNLFDFFFFDGEQIADFFANSNYNNYIKSSLLTLCSFDTFDIIRKFCNNYVIKGKDSIEVNLAISEYENIIQEIDDLEISISEGDLTEENLKCEAMELKSKIIDLNAKFQKAGGLPDEEKESLILKSNELEKIKNESNLYVKNFVEGIMPFSITKKITGKISSQLEKENDFKKYLVLEEKLTSDEVKVAVMNAMKNHNLSTIGEAFIDELTIAITSAVKPDINIENFILMHDLSNEEQNKINIILSNISKFSDDSMIKRINHKELASKQTVLINKKLREAMSDIDIKSFTDQLSILNVEENEATNKLIFLQEQQLQSMIKIDNLKNKKDYCYEIIKTDARNKNAYELTEKVSMLMNNMISELTLGKFKQIESYMLDVMKKIMRKDNFIDLIEMDEDFNIAMYKKQTYQYSEIKNLFDNIGYEELANRIGKDGIKKLESELKTDSIKKSLKETPLKGNKSIDLYKKIEFSQLSKGEKQIFILSLYWAIIKVSNIEIPFIIDTPYARIDTEHREQISREFFPNISSQVIILSTDEEITRAYYSVLKPYISKEYLLQYNEIESKTIVLSEYFFKE